MRRLRSTFATAAVAVALVIAGSAFSAKNACADTVVENLNVASSLAIDLAVLRWLGLGRLAMGTFVAMPISSFLNAIALPISQDTTVFSEDLDRYIVAPYDYVFERPMGEDLAGF